MSQGTITKPSPKIRSPRFLRKTLVTVQDFIHWEATGGVLLLIASAIALILANSPWSAQFFHFWETKIGFSIGSFELSLSIHHWINDALMAVFFMVVGLEIKRELLVGELRDRKKALLPSMAAIGGMVVPAIVYFIFNVGQPTSDGWAIPMATDIAFALGIMALLGKRVPLELKIFLAALAIVDDIAAVMVIAIFYTEQITIMWLVAAIFLLGIAAIAGRFGVNRPFIFFTIAAAVWLAMHESGLHATLAGILVAITVPAKSRIDPREYFNNDCARLENISSLEWSEQSVLTNKDQQRIVKDLNIAANKLEPPLIQLEHNLHPYVSFMILPLFALANAGVVINSDSWKGLLDPLSLGIILGLVVGKQVGVTLFSWIAIKLGWASVPDSINMKYIYGASWLTGIGFTMSLFITDLAFTDPLMQDKARIAILLASLVAGLGGYLILNRVLPKKSKAQVTE